MSTLSSDQYHGSLASKACRTCQRRRRWCDKTLPGCLSCAGARRKCEGYAPAAVRTFVNMTATNICTPNKKQLLCEAITSSRKLNDGTVDNEHQDLREHEPISSHSSILSGGVPDLFNPQIGFRQHLEGLWRTFMTAYCKTEDYWPPGCSWLAFRNRSLDLALVAISAQRLALFSPSNRLHQLSLEAYNQSIGLYLSMMQNHMDNWSTALLAVTSTLYALMEASLMQPHDIASFGWGNSGHFDGALELTMRSGPEVFSAPGFHLVFKKVREMGVFLAMSRRQETFLQSDNWMNGPWVSQNKTWRDKLFDLAMRFSAISADQASCDRLQDASTHIPAILQIDADLERCRSLWLEEAHPNAIIRCVCHSSTSLSCTCSVPAQDFPTIEFGLLQVEFWALQLLIGTRLNEMAADKGDCTASISNLPARLTQLASHIEAVNSFYAANRSSDRSSGISEDICRLILPLWALREYQAKALSTVE